jgi:t-SNARE complex subunit (syntaxin)
MIEKNTSRDMKEHIGKFAILDNGEVIMVMIPPPLGYRVLYVSDSKMEADQVANLLRVGQNRVKRHLAGVLYRATNEMREVIDNFVAATNELKENERWLADNQAYIPKDKAV